MHSMHTDTSCTSTDRFSEQSLLRFQYYGTSITLSMSTTENSDHTDQKERSANDHCTNAQEYRPSTYPCSFVGFLKQLGAPVRLFPWGKGVPSSTMLPGRRNTRVHTFSRYPTWWSRNHAGDRSRLTNAQLCAARDAG